MSEGDRGMEDPSPPTAGLGERRRRREAERAAALAAARDDAPLSRKELRRRAAEEEARLEALRTGELRLDGSVAPVPDRPSGASPQTGESGATDGGAPAALPADSGTTARPDAGAAAQPLSGATSDDAAPGQPSSDAGSGDGAPGQPTSGATAAGGVSGQPTSDAGSPDAAPSAASGSTGAIPRLSRRSLRERQPVDPVPAETPPSQRTATGRRPVVRTPSTAQGTRTIDSTGRLTGIIPVVPAEEPAPERSVPMAPEEPGVGPQAEGSADPVSWESTAGMPVMSEEILDRESERLASPQTPAVVPTPVPAEPSPAAAPSPGEAAAAAGAVPGDDEPGEVTAPDGTEGDVTAPDGTEGDVTAPDGTEDSDDEDADGPLRPQWVALAAADPAPAQSVAGSAASARSALSAGSADTAASDDGARTHRAQGSAPARRSLGDRTRSAARLESDAPAGGVQGNDGAGPVPTDPQPEDVEDGSTNPAVAFVKVLVLLLVAAVIGALIWLLYSGALGADDGAILGTIGTVGSAQALSVLPEESRAS
ncbi:hypothetical protein V2J56_06155 [Georgenia sp. MJ206]|uniref:hypothetical protein n=1 Tax=Georgenia wangjunii TaxID=3117730 RepID=UPI002F269FCA